MNYFGAYHADIRSRALDSCDAPRISKGQMTVAGYETASDADGMAMVYGRMRNRRALARELGYLTAHSAFHLMGYDHMTDEDQRAMRAMEKRAMQALQLWRAPKGEMENDAPGTF